MVQEEQLRQRYNESLKFFYRACTNIEEALKIFLIEKKIAFLAVSTRVKDFDSFFEKIDRKKYNDAFTENEDFCGARIILYYLNDIEKVQNIISQEFEVQTNEDKGNKLEINEFGYRSHHYIVKFKEQWLVTPNYRGLKDIKIEIQIRTVLMHAWAEIEHKLGYKNKEQIPTNLKRKLFMISAKLEEADGQFQDLKGNIESYKDELIVDSTKTGKFTSKEFNLNSFQALMDFYFPGLEKSLVRAAELFVNIQNRQISLSQVIDYAEKIKPFESLIHSLVCGENSGRKTSQNNVMSYAIEALSGIDEINPPSAGRLKIINTLKKLIK